MFNLSNTLSAVVVPANVREKDQILANLKLWSRPGLHPVTSARKKLPVLAFVFNNEGARADTETAITDAFEEHGMGRFFSSLELHYLNLTGAADAYIRDYRQPSGEMGYKAGPNNQFFSTMRWAKKFGYYAFLMESDCVPIQSNWVGRLCDICESSEPFYLMGSAYRGKGTLGVEFGRHINGNGVYAVGDFGFQSFVDEFWEPRLRKIVAEFDARIAYDCALEVIFSQMNSGWHEDQDWRFWQSHAHLFRYTSYIQNLSADLDIAAPEEFLVSDTLFNSPHTYLIHSQPLAREVRKAMAADSLKAIQEWRLLPPETLNIDGGDAAFSEPSVHYLGNREILADGRVKLEAPFSTNSLLYVFDDRLDRGVPIEATVEFNLEQPAALVVALSRHGATKFESSDAILELPAGNHTIKIVHRFEQVHYGARVQIGVLNGTAQIGLGKCILAKLQGDEAEIVGGARVVTTGQAIPTSTAPGPKKGKTWIGSLFRTS